jgi:hypothetical protein
MWWTDGDLLVHAQSTDADLGWLFTWWRTHPME